MFGFIAKRQQIRTIAKGLLNQSTMGEPLFRFDGLAEFESDNAAKQVDRTKAPILIRTFFVEYALRNVFRHDATEKDFAILMDTVAYEMESHPMFGKQAIVYWDDLIDTGISIFGKGDTGAKSREAYAKMFGFWFLKNIGYPGIHYQSEVSLEVGTKLLENVRRVLNVPL